MHFVINTAEAGFFPLPTQVLDFKTPPSQGPKWCITGVLICVSWIIAEAQHLFLFTGGVYFFFSGWTSQWV